MANISYSDKLIRLGLNIAYHRKMKLLTQEKLSEKVGVERSYISRIETPNMYTSISLELLCKIADALDVTESKLLEFR